ncbi:MDR family MFS transporter [Camelliibacillus cellulosilyticus]|uniref:MDR family MFS transporter n=1 Tax=Camelliibacillus cellulosilyticus TaxID=2174486 RepID=A0ABV9GRR4_9BACL
MEEAIKSKIQTTNQITGQRKWWALATVLMTMFFSSMNQTVVSTAIPSIVGDLDGFSLYAWIFSAYMITSAITVPIYGKLSDVYGRKPFYLFGLIMFAIGSIISGLAQSMLMFVIARAIQGIGAGAMMSMPRATVGDIFNPKERGRWMGVMGAVFGVSSILGPTIGGWITDHWGWHWVFYINLPFAVLAIIGVIFTLPKVRTNEQAKIDWIGSLLLVIGLIPVLLAFTWAGTKYAWTSAIELTLFGVGIIFLILFYFYERKAASPVISTALFKNRIFTTSLILGIFVSMGMFGALMFLPLYVQGVIGLNAKDSGLVMSPMMLAFIVGSIGAGQIMSKTGKYRRLSHVCALFMIVGLFLFMRMDIHTNYPTVIINMIILGIGVGSLMPLLNIAVQNAFPYKLMGTVNSTQQFVGSLGGVIASPIFGSILDRGFEDKLKTAMPDQLTQMSDKLSKVDPQSLLTADAQKAIAANFEKMGAAGMQLYHSFLHAVKVSITAGIHHLFIVGVIFAVLCFIGTFFLPEVKLKGDEYYKEEGQKEA